MISKIEKNSSRVPRRRRFGSRVDAPARRHGRAGPGRLSCLLFAVLLGAVPALSQPQPGVLPMVLPGAENKLIIEKIEITGNSKTRRQVILRYLTFQPGETIAPADIEESWESLSATNFFKSIDFYTRPGSARGKVVVMVEVVERHWPYVQFEGGYSDLSGWYFVPFSLRLDNLFGRGQFWDARVYLSDRVQKFSLHYRNASLFDAATTLDAELFGAGTQILYYLNGEQLVHQVNFGGLRLRLAGNRGLFKYFYFGLRSETYTPEESAHFAANDSLLPKFRLPRQIAGDLEPKRVVAFSGGLQADFRDNRHYPMNGFWGGIMAEKSHRELNSDIDFNRYTLDARIYKRLFGMQVLAVNLKAGYTTANAPFYQRFYLGGAYSLRGYPERRLTPIGYATKLFLTNIEFRFPFTRPNGRRSPAYGALFFDTGGIWLPGQEPAQKDLYRSAGFGFRFNLPVVGLVRFDFAFPLDRIEENDFKLHISLGHAF